MGPIARISHTVGTGALARARSCLLAGTLALAAVAAVPATSSADEGGVSFWLPGLFGSLAATPVQPGWTFSATYYHWQGSGGADVAAAREVTIGRFSPTLGLSLIGNINSSANLMLNTATYVFGTPVLGGQATIGLLSIVGKVDTSLDALLVGTVAGIPVASRFDSINDSVTGFGDLYPMATLRWNHGVDNFMVYVTGDLPVGKYNSSSLANIGIGHYAIDAGVGYTYLNPQTGHELSVVTGFTYNFINPATQYQNGVDWHLDWGMSQFVSKQMFVGAVGYFYKDIGCDSGSGNRVGCFQSQVIGMGPQIGFLFPVGDMQGLLNLKVYKEFNNEERLGGWDAWVTFVISPAPTPSAARPIVTKY